MLQLFVRATLLPGRMRPGPATTPQLAPAATQRVHQAPQDRCQLHARAMACGQHRLAAATSPVSGCTVLQAPKDSAGHPGVYVLADGLWHFKCVVDRIDITTCKVKEHYMQPAFQAQWGCQEGFLPRRMLHYIPEYEPQQLPLCCWQWTAACC